MMPTSAPVPSPFPSSLLDVLVDDDDATAAVLSKHAEDVGLMAVIASEEDIESSVGAALMDGCVDFGWRVGSDDDDPNRLERLISVKLPVKLALGRIYVDPSFTGETRKRLCVNRAFL